MKLTSTFTQREASSPPWTWASCNHPKTLSSRSGEDTFKTMDLIFSEQIDEAETALPWPEYSSEDVVAREARSERLFFEAAGESSSILEGKEKVGRVCFEENLVVAMESEDPYVDFRKSMEEMVECGGFVDWEFLEELLSWYLRVNGKMNHGFNRWGLFGSFDSSCHHGRRRRRWFFLILVLVLLTFLFLVQKGELTMCRYPGPIAREKVNHSDSATHIYKDFT